MAEGRPGVVVPAGGGRHVHGRRACITVKLAAGDAEDGRVSAIELLVPPDFGPPLHVHHREDELVQVLDGRLRVRCGDDDQVVGPGGFAFLPRGVPHGFRSGPEGARFLCVFTPGGVEAMFVDAGVEAPAQELPAEGTVAAGAMEPFEQRHGVETVGDPLEPFG
jgi:quercetin dioxygenase-like cupin family protein